MVRFFLITAAAPFGTRDVPSGFFYVLGSRPRRQLGALYGFGICVLY